MSAIARFVRKVEDVLMTIKDLRRAAPTAEEARLADRLRADLDAIGREAHGATQSDFWFETCNALRACAHDGDPRDFMRWGPIAGTMVHRTSRASVGALATLRRSEDWTRWREVLRHPNVGNAPPFLAAPWTSAISAQHASHLLHFRRLTGSDFLDADIILDMGAGYASMCRLIKRLGYRGDYIIFDQPPVLALQRYFLGRHGIEAAYGEFGPSRVALCRAFDRMRALIRPGARVALISTWAMSEMPIDVRRQIEPFIGEAEKVLLAYQPEVHRHRQPRLFRGAGGAAG
ncbi:MAG: hypothetical protein JNM30_20730 [Rhodospirillales bacterium]|nr:hypothetical protein [Rhodospirillales bacterium]